MILDRTPALGDRSRLAVGLLGESGRADIWYPDLDWAEALLRQSCSMLAQPLSDPALVIANLLSYM